MDEDTPEFPTTHELIMKDHTKVISALALDPSGARIVSGSHDYDCKLWDFGGMDYRCKPFKSWEPSGSYYVSVFPYSCEAIKRGFIFFRYEDAEMRRVDSRPQVFERWSKVSLYYWHDPGKVVRPRRRRTVSNVYLYYGFPFS